MGSVRMAMSVKFSASVLAANLLNLREDIERVLPFIDEIHLDVMDGHFVPNLTFGYPILEAINGVFGLPIEAHLMIANPQEHFERFIEKGATRVTIHYETCPHLHRAVTRIRELGAEAFVTINPATPLLMLEEILPFVDGVLIMTVNPGYSGQSFIGNMFDKVKRLAEMRERRKLSFLIEVDGGVGNENAKRLVNVGVDILVMGYGVFRNPNLSELSKELRGK